MGKKRPRHNLHKIIKIIIESWEGYQLYVSKELLSGKEIGHLPLYLLYIPTNERYYKNWDINSWRPAYTLEEYLDIWLRLSATDTLLRKHNLPAPSNKTLCKKLYKLVRKYSNGQG